MKIAFAGTPEPAAVVLEKLLESEHEICAVITRPDAQQGRGRKLIASPVARVAEEKGIRVIKTDTLKDTAILDQIRSLGVDAIPVVAFGAIVPPDALSLARFGWLNLHFSLLPAYRGAAPVQASIRAGDQTTGVTIFRIDEGLDTGPILASREHDIAQTITAGELLDELAQVGADLFVDVLNTIEGGEYHPTPQSDDEASYAPKITVDQAQVSWNDEAQVIDCHIRSMSPNPGAWTVLDDQRIKLDRVTPTTGTTDPYEASLELEPGEITWKKNRVWVGTATDPVLLTKVQAPGKKMMGAGDWIRGARLSEGARFQ